MENFFNSFHVVFFQLKVLSTYPSLSSISLSSSLFLFLYSSFSLSFFSFFRPLYLSLSLSSSLSLPISFLFWFLSPSLPLSLFFPCSNLFFPFSLKWTSTTKMSKQKSEIQFGLKSNVIRKYKSSNLKQFMKVC